MPIEIKELIIKATVVDESEKGSKESAPANTNQVSSDESIIRRCVEQIMSILETKNER